MKNITVSVPDDVYRAARIRAAERGSSVSALVSDYLRSLSDRDAELARATPPRWCSRRSRLGHGFKISLAPDAQRVRGVLGLDARRPWRDPPG
jgi:hypothetical protein